MAHTAQIFLLMLVMLVAATNTSLRKASACCGHKTKQAYCQGR